MESFAVSKDLIDNKEEVKNKFGNIKFFRKGKCVFNTKSIGLYFTIFLIVGSYSFILYLMYL